MNLKRVDERLIDDESEEVEHARKIGVESFKEESKKEKQKYKSKNK